MQNLQSKILNVLFNNVNVVYISKFIKRISLNLDLDCSDSENDCVNEVRFLFCPSSGSTRWRIMAVRSGKPGLSFISRPREVSYMDVVQLKAALDGLSLPELRCNHLDLGQC